MCRGPGSYRFKKLPRRDFPGGPVVKTLLPMQGVRVRSLVLELRSHLLHGVSKNKVKYLLKKLLRKG